jgi:prepilin-type processing-associated H-X9-DG protein
MRKSRRPRASSVGTTSAGGVQSGTEYPGGTRATPFIWFNTAGTQANPTLLQDRRISRVLSYVRKSADMIMIAEAANPNWHDPLVSAKYPGLYMKKLAARHGKRSANGANAWLNFAFFDGHVSILPTEPISKTGFANMREAQGAIFYIGRQFK